MSMKDLERAILAELKITVNNPKLKMKDVLEWSTGTVEPQEGEIIITLPVLKINCAIKEELNLNS